MCAMEMVSWLAGEAHSDEPRCACPVLAALVRACNDAMGDAARNLHLRPLVPRLVNTKSTRAVEAARGFAAVDMMARTLLPRHLERRGRGADARQLRALQPIDSPLRAGEARRALEPFAADVRAAAWVLDRAKEGAPPQRFVAGVIQFAHGLDGGAVWTEISTLIVAMVHLGAEAAPVLAPRS